MEFKVGDIVKFKSKESGGTRWFIHGLENLEVINICSDGLSCSLKEYIGSNIWSVSCNELELMKILSIKERKVYIKKIVKEIEGNENYNSCFQNVKTEVESWNDTKLKNWK